MVRPTFGWMVGFLEVMKPTSARLSDDCHVDWAPHVLTASCVLIGGWLRMHNEANAPIPLRGLLVDGDFAPTEESILNGYEEVARDRSRVK